MRFRSYVEPTIEARNGMYILSCGYEPAMLAEMKAVIPATERKWDNTSKTWAVTAQYGGAIKDLVERYFHKVIQLPNVSQNSVVEFRELKIIYIGATKERGGEERSAFGLLEDGSWGVVFPESVLRSWFDEAGSPLGENNLYSILGSKRSYSQDEIKSAYRRMAKQWHPDICKEINAREVFLRIQEAYNILSDNNKRARYDAGLALQMSIGIQPVQVSSYRAPLRCGYLLCMGSEKLGRFVVSEIIVWDDIFDGDKTLVVSWPSGASEPVREWV